MLNIYGVSVMSMFSVQVGSYFSSLYTVYAQQEIDKEAIKVHPELEVSRTLMFSSPDVQEQFYLWMSKFEAVRWQPWVALGCHLVFASWVPISRDGCRCVHFLTLLSVGILPVVRLVMENRGVAKRDQSLCSTISAAYFYLLYFPFQASNDVCFGGVGPDGTSLAATVAFAALATMVDHYISPCTMQHLTALCWVIGLGIFFNVYTQYLQQNGGLNIWKSDPNLIGLLGTGLGTSLAILVVYCTRVFLTKKLMVAFLKSIRRNQ